MVGFSSRARDTAYKKFLKTGKPWCFKCRSDHDALNILIQSKHAI